MVKALSFNKIEINPIDRFLSTFFQMKNNICSSKEVQKIKGRIGRTGDNVNYTFSLLENLENVIKLRISRVYNVIIDISVCFLDE